MDLVDFIFFNILKCFSSSHKWIFVKRFFKAKILFQLQRHTKRNLEKKLNLFVENSLFLLFSEY